MTDVRIDVVTIFPDYLAPLELSLIGKARAAGLLDIRLHDLRRAARDRHHTVDDTPYGGGAGMVMKPEPWGEILDALADTTPLGDAAPRVDATPHPILIVPTPGGQVFTQALAHTFATERRLVFACGRYEGIDRRVIDDAAARYRVHEVSLGDYVLGGGEVAALVMIEAITRLIPGVIGNAESLTEESHADGLLEYPVYTKPDEWRGRPVPPVLLSGHHGAIARWRRDESLRRTARNRPDLLRLLDPAACDKADFVTLEAAGWVLGADGRFSPLAPPVPD